MTERVHTQALATRNAKLESLKKMVLQDYTKTDGRVVPPLSPTDEKGLVHRLDTESVKRRREAVAEAEREMVEEFRCKTHAPPLVWMSKEEITECSQRLFMNEKWKRRGSRVR
jgi:hypothetical protein